jgi:hypothetical protein
MSKFLSTLEVELLNDATNAGRGTWQLLIPLVYQSDVAAHVFTVPAGFKTDFASVPRVPIAFLLTADSAHEAATLHDYLYSTHCVTRSLADAVLREAAIASGVPAWRAALMWAGVRVFGGAFWR